MNAYFVTRSLEEIRVGDTVLLEDSNTLPQLRTVIKCGEFYSKFFNYPYLGVEIAGGHILTNKKFIVMVKIT